MDDNPESTTTSEKMETSLVGDGPESTSTNAKMAESTNPSNEKISQSSGPDLKGKMKNMKLIIAALGVSTIGLLIGVIVLATQDNSDSSSKEQVDTLQKEVDALTVENEEMKADFVADGQDYGNNPCEGMRPDLANTQCLAKLVEDFSPGQDMLDNGTFATGPQSGVNVTKGYQGNRNVDYVPITKPYREVGLCPVNVHWHIGSEHYSMGEFDEVGTGPIDFHEGRQGFQCRYYDENDEKFTKQYKWNHCIGMAVGQTYEVHWPHSSAGACNEPWQYQSPFYDGVFCNLPFEDFLTMSEQDIAYNVGVQSQTFVVVNDESFYYPDLFSGMIVDSSKNQGTDLAMYTGSTTGTQRDNEVCSPFSPITWHVDRKCHMVSASSFDRMCKQMEQQADNMKDDLYAHGSREMVLDMHAADNHQSRRGRGLRSSSD